MNRHLMTVSIAALLATAGVAIAQTPKGDAGAPAQSAPAQSAPADKGARAPSNDVQTPGTQKQSAPDKGAQSGQAPAKSGDAQQKKAGDMPKDKAGDKQQKAGETTKDKAGDKQQKAGETTKDKAGDKQQKAGETTKDKAGDKQQKAGETTKGTTAGSGTSQSGGGEVRQGSQTNVTVNVTQEQKTRARTVFSSRRSGAVVANINITPRIGIAVPRTVTLVAIPEEVFVIVPEYRRYRYFIVDDQVVIVDPDTFVIIDVILLA